MPSNKKCEVWFGKIDPTKLVPVNGILGYYIKAMAFIKSTEKNSNFKWFNDKVWVRLNIEFIGYRREIEYTKIFGLTIDI